MSGCDIDQTQAGELPDVDVDAGELPEYDVVKREDGELPDVDVEGGRLPKFDVDWMDVDVGLTEVTVNVPKLRLVVEEETITVPKVDMDWPNEDEVTKKTVRAQVEAPDDGYDLHIQKIYVVRDELLVISRLDATGNSENPGQPQRISDYVVVSVPDLDVEHYIVGQRPDRDFNDDLHFVDDERELADELEGARLIYENEG